MQARGFSLGVAHEAPPCDAKHRVAGGDERGVPLAVDLERVVAGVVSAADELGDMKAFVSLRPGADVEPDALIAFCKARMAAYNYPRQIEIVEELPKTVTGKLLRRELRDREQARTTG